MPQSAATHCGETGVSTAADMGRGYGRRGPCRVDASSGPIRLGASYGVLPKSAVVGRGVRTAPSCEVQTSSSRLRSRRRADTPPYHFAVEGDWATRPCFLAQYERPCGDRGLCRYLCRNLCRPVPPRQRFRQRFRRRFRQSLRQGRTAHVVALNRPGLS